MPKSDTWPGGTGLETMTVTDSAGSCDSVVSVNSGFSNDSLEHLSAEEKACLMFLEETIDSLDTEDDSGLSNDESDLPVPGNLATKMAHLTASLDTNKLDRSPKQVYEELSKDTYADHKAIQNYLVPTPFVLANCSPCSMPLAKPGFHKENPKPQFISSNSKPGPQYSQQQGALHVSSEVNVVVIPPPTKPKEYPSQTPEGTTPRGPLSYEALVHLRRSASTKTSPLCPTLDHTIESDKCPPASATPIHPNHWNLPRAPLEVPSQESHRSKASPPDVAPKPKRMPTNVSIKTHNEITCPTPDSSSSDRRLPDPQKVRLEALQKLGLLKDKEPEQKTVTSPSKSHPCWDLNANRFVRSQAQANPSRSPSFSYTQVPTEPKVRPVQSSASFHHHSRSEQSSVPLSHRRQPVVVKAVTLERSGNHVSFQPTPVPRSATPGSQRSDEHYLTPVHTKAPETGNAATSAQPVPHTRPTNQGYSVMMVPGMGEDRKEALRKLGLLKDC